MKKLKPFYSLVELSDALGHSLWPFRVLREEHVVETAQSKRDVETLWRVEVLELAAEVSFDDVRQILATDETFARSATPNLMLLRRGPARNDASGYLPRSTVRRTFSDSTSADVTKSAGPLSSISRTSR